MNWSKNVRTSVWRASVRNQWHGHVRPAKEATANQISYIGALLERLGRPPLSLSDLEGLSIGRASTMINDLRSALPTK